MKNVCKKRKPLARAGLDVVDIDPQCGQALAELIVDHAMLAFLPHEILGLPQQHGIGDLVTVIAHALTKLPPAKAGGLAHPVLTTKVIKLALYKRA